MASGSARPRIESVAEFVLTIDEPPEEILECPTYEEFVAEPTYTVIGEGSDGEIVLDSDALCIEEGGDSYCLAVAILGMAWSADMPFGWRTDETWDPENISDDSAEPVPDYLKLDGSNCFNGAWRTKKIILDNELSDQVDTTTDDHPHEGETVQWGLFVAVRALNNLVPAGSTITYDVGGDPASTLAKALLIKNAAPYTSSTRGADGSNHINDFFGTSGWGFAGSWDTNCRANTCGIFAGTYCDGLTSMTDGDPIVNNVFGTDHTWWSPDGDDGGPSGMDCEQEDVSGNWRADLNFILLPSGGLTISSPGRGSAGAYCWPSQGYY